jgi:hypothetical protein
MPDDPIPILIALTDPRFEFHQIPANALHTGRPRSPSLTPAPSLAGRLRRLGSGCLLPRSVSHRRAARSSGSALMPPAAWLPCCTTMRWHGQQESQMPIRDRSMRGC